MLARIIGLLRYHPKLARITHRLQRADDFRWQTYTQDDYKPRLEAASKQETRQLAQVPWTVKDGVIVLGSGTNPLNPGHRLIYETAIKLKADTICEFGFGAGDHLANLGLLLPEAKLIGFEVSEGQLQYARERNPLPNARLIVRDMTLPDSARGFEDSADFVYCNAVMMHIHGRQRHLTFLQNMIRVSRRYVLFTENWLRHDFAADVSSLGQIPLLVRNGASAAVLIDKQKQAAYPPASDPLLKGLDF